MVACSIQNQDQNINQSRDPYSGKSEGGQSFPKVFRRWKLAKAIVRISASTQIPSDNPSTQPDMEWNSKNEEKDFSRAKEVWETRKMLAAEWRGDEWEALHRISTLEARDRDG
ncbi:hypothetical protein Ancab_016423 [Ancistrocladus abbreviatus]